ncbi:hypothetical protein ACFV8Z_11770 [Streptomyces sp. NPDC059837]|uniref:hypothetical protein n=1 Tax=unclassified Streptomyces TaxID=2593676 RepID=UPI002258C9FD|nr:MULTISPECIES: hypothetical protein [unclassified Streptomyces]MCX4411318.1 hypothetical protein [Streptomyces sp. NBC_01764]MCX5192226.1 hypothetical protein [Streptomyces sp. NBC_00268]
MISISPIPEPYGVVGSVGDGDHGRAFAADATSTGRLDDHRPDAPRVLTNVIHRP